MISADITWAHLIDVVYKRNRFEVEPRNQKVKEVIAYNYHVDMSNPVVGHIARNLNYSFMFAEAAWILQGRNDLKYIENYMSSYANFSDDYATLNGAYGPKIMDQISWAATELAYDNDSRRAYINIWRERPYPSKDIPCTTGMQFLIRDGKLFLLVNMRSQDVVWGTPYDMFTFSAIAKYMQLFLWKHRKVGVDLGALHVRANSLHIYEKHFDQVDYWLENRAVDGLVNSSYVTMVCDTDDPDVYVKKLEVLADHYKKNEAAA